MPGSRLLAFRSLIKMGATLLYRWSAYKDVLCSPLTLVLTVKSGKYLIPWLMVSPKKVMWKVWNCHHCDVSLAIDTSPSQPLKTIVDLLTDTTGHDAISLPILDPDDIVALFQTSGRTGTPKFVPRTHASCMHVRRIAGGQGLQYLSSTNAFNEIKCNRWRLCMDTFSHKVCTYTHTTYEYGITTNWTLR